MNGCLLRYLVINTQQQLCSFGTFLPVLAKADQSDVYQKVSATLEKFSCNAANFIFCQAVQEQRVSCVSAFAK